MCPRQKTSKGERVKRRKVHRDKHTYHNDTTFRNVVTLRNSIQKFR